MLFALWCITPLMKILQSLIKRESKDNQRATYGTIFLNQIRKTVNKNQQTE